MKSNVFKAAIIAAGVALAPLAAHAQWWQQHPGYLHAMSDLREAYWLVTHQDTANPMKRDEEARAARAISGAYQSLQDASIVDNKNINDQPPPDMNFPDRAGRLHKAMDLLRDAHNRIDHEEDDPAARGFKFRALRQIDNAAQATNAAIHAWNF